MHGLFTIFLLSIDLNFSFIWGRAVWQNFDEFSLGMTRTIPVFPHEYFRATPCVGRFSWQQQDRWMRQREGGWTQISYFLKLSPLFQQAVINVKMHSQNKQTFHIFTAKKKIIIILIVFTIIEFACCKMEAGLVQIRSLLLLQLWSALVCLVRTTPKWGTCWATAGLN